MDRRLPLPETETRSGRHARGKNLKRTVRPAVEAQAPAASARPQQELTATAPLERPEPVSLPDQKERARTLKAALEARYVVRHGTHHQEYRFRDAPARVAFVDRGTRLTTEMDSREVARSMVDLAESKGWTVMRVRGTGDFRQQVWREASLRQLKVVGHEPSQEDRQWLAREREARQCMPPEHTGSPPTPGPQARSIEPAEQHGGSRRQVLSVLRSVLVAQRVDAHTTEEVLRAASARMDRLERAGQALPQLRVYDRQAPRATSVRVHAPRETRERPARSR